MKETDFLKLPIWEKGNKTDWFSLNNAFEKIDENAKKVNSELSKIKDVVIITETQQIDIDLQPNRIVQQSASFSITGAGDIVFYQIKECTPPECICSIITSYDDYCQITAYGVAGVHCVLQVQRITLRKV